MRLKVASGPLRRALQKPRFQPERPLEEIAAWAAGAGYEALELAAWPSAGDRPFTATHVAADALDDRELERVGRALGEHGLTLSALAYYDNNLHPDPQEREAVHAHLCAASTRPPPSAAAPSARSSAATRALGGRQPARGRAGVRAAGGLRRQRGVRLMIENCVMEGWHPDGYPGNLAYSPELWEWMFGLGLWLNFDPSHLLWLGIDPVAALRPTWAGWRTRTRRTRRRSRSGATVTASSGASPHGRSDPWDMGWWRYRIPGLGQVDFRRYVDALYEGGFDGVLSVEHEDPVWGGTPEKVEQGLVIAHTHLRPMVVG